MSTRRLHKTLMTAALLAAGVTSARAQGTAPTLAQRRAVCTAAADRHRFDFWIGDWTVTTPSGGTAGASHIESIAGGCGILENWTGAGGGQGKSINSFNPLVGQWQQYWVGQDGTVTEYRESSWKDGSLVFVSRPPAAAANAMLRLTFTPLNDSTVRQHGEQSADGGATWVTTYHRQSR